MELQKLLERKACDKLDREAEESFQGANEFLRRCASFPRIEIGGTSFGIDHVLLMVKHAAISDLTGRAIEREVVDFYSKVNALQVTP